MEEKKIINDAKLKRNFNKLVTIVRMKKSVSKKKCFTASEVIFDALLNCGVRLSM